MKKNLLMIFALLCVVVHTARAEWESSGKKLLTTSPGYPIDLAEISEPYQAQDGDVFTGTLTSKVKISISDGATITLSGVTINGEDKPDYEWAGLTCLGDATIILDDGTENVVRGFYQNFPGIYIPKNKTLIIEGNGTLNVSSGDKNLGGAAAIGGSWGLDSGNIIIKGGNINAKGSSLAPAIGCGNNLYGERNTGGFIRIEGGTVYAEGGRRCGGIGGGFLSDQGPVTITKDAVVTAIAGESAPYSIGQADNRLSDPSTCGTVTVGCTLDGDGNPVGGHVGPVSASPFTYFCYTIAFDGNGGSGSMAPQEVERGFDSKKKLSNAFSRDGCQFMGWVAENAGTRKFYREGTKFSDIDVKPNTTVTMYAQWLVGDGTAEHPYEIASEGDWLMIAYYMRTDGYTNYYNKHYKLMADISLTETVAKGATPVSMFGIGDERSFRGTFDGNRHMITLNITDNREEHYCGPFRIINGATIKNLHVTGTIVKTTWKHVGGIVGKALGTNTITNCRSSVDIQLNTDGDCSSGGFIGDLRSGTTTLTGCLFDGKLRGPGGTASRSKKWGGFIGWVADGRKAIFNTCVFAPAEININSKSDCRTFARRDDGDDVTLNNCYYAETLGSAQGKQAYSIAGNEHVSVDFYETPEVDGRFNVSGIESYHMGNYIKVGVNLYSLGGKEVHLSLQQNGATPGGYVANSFIAIPATTLYMPVPDAFYLLKMPNSNVTISLLPTDWTGSGTQNDPYLIYNDYQWQLLVSRVNDGENGGYKDKFFRLMSDITLTEEYSDGNSTVMIGTDTKDENRIDINANTRFRGTFDGNGHIITLNLTDNSDDDYCGLFRFIRDATIKRLHVAGTIVKSGGKHIGGLVGKAEGLNNTISSCRCSVDILSNEDGDASSGGFIGDVRGERVDQRKYEFENPDWVYPVTTFTNCLFDGKLRGKKAYKWGGFVGYAAQYNILYFNSCLFNPSEIDIDINDGDDNSRTFARMYHDNETDEGTNIHTTDCYYTYCLKEEPQDAHNANGIENDVLVDDLGTGWNLFGDEVLPIMGVYTFDGNGTQSSPYIIASASDWNGLSSNVSAGENYNGKYIQLGANITVTRTVGRSATNCFRGHFDGAGNKLTFNYTGAKENIAPFGFVNGATIENLHVDGTINASDSYVAGLIIDAKGENNIRNCRSSITLNCTATEEYESIMWSGFIVKIEEGTTVFTGCVFDGNFLSDYGYKPINSAGFVSHTWKEAVVVVNDCAFDPVGFDINPQSFTSFVRGSATVSINNSYYFLVEGNQGKDAIEIIADDGITMEGNGIVTEYDVSGITGYLTGLKYKDNLIAAYGEEMRLNLGYDDPGYTVTGYTVTSYGSPSGTITGTKSPYILVINNPDVFSVTIDALTVRNTLELADNADNIEAISTAAESGNTYDVTLTGRTLYKDGNWNTLCLPFGVVFEGSLLEDATVIELDTEGWYDGEGVRYDDEAAGRYQTSFDSESGALHLYFQPATAIEAGKPYLVKWTSGSNITDPVFDNCYIEENTPTTVRSQDGNVQFRGNYSPVMLEGGDNSSLYLGSSNRLYWPSADRTLHAFRGYFHVILGGGVSQVREFHLNLDDYIVTGVQEFKGSIVQDADAEGWFTLSGIRLSGKPTNRGVYIHNGKKVVVTNE